MNAARATDEPVSRRERPAKAALTRRGVIDAALTILRQQGLRRVTMRRIAAVLDTGPASLYVYVRDTEDLHAQILDALLGSVTRARSRHGTWQARLKKLLARYKELLLAHPEMARMAMSTQPSGPRYLALVDRILALLREGGVADRQAAWAVDLLLLLATASAVEHGAPRPSSRGHIADLTLALQVAAADARSYPHIARHGDDLVSGTGAERFEWCVDALLAGIRRTRRPAAGQRTRRA